MTQLQFWMAALLFAIPIKKRRPLWPRILVSIGIWLALLVPAVWMRTHWPDAATRLPVMLINVGFTLPVLFLILDDHPFSVLSTWCAAVAAEEIVATVYDLLMIPFGVDTSAALLFFTTGDMGWDLLVYLLIRGVIRWQIPVCMLGTVALMSWILGKDPLTAVLSGGVLFGAVFMATDYVTTPMLKIGQAIFGVGCGILVVLIRNYGNYPEGVTYAILIMNIVTPLLDRSLKRKVYGEVKQNG